MLTLAIDHELSKFSLRDLKHLLACEVAGAAISLPEHGPSCNGRCYEEGRDVCSMRLLAQTLNPLEPTLFGKPMPEAPACGIDCDFVCGSVSCCPQLEVETVAQIKRIHLLEDAIKEKENATDNQPATAV